MMPFDEETFLQSLFGYATPQEAIEYFAAKLVTDSDTFKLLEEDAKRAAFTVSGLAESAMLEEVYDSITVALEEGQGFAKWKKQFKDKETFKGWPRHRQELIYRNNVFQAKAAGAWKQQQESKLTHPYLVYYAVADTRTRESHMIMHKICLPIEHSFWKTFYPPNGHGCRCWVIAVTKHVAEKIGITKAPVGDVDGGFDYNPGLEYDKRLDSLKEIQEQKTQNAAKKAEDALAQHSENKL